MIGYILQAILLLGFIYLITFRVKEKSILIYIFSLLIALLALANVCINIYMISIASANPLNEVFSKVYLWGDVIGAFTWVIGMIVLVPTIAIGARSSQIEDINHSLEKNQVGKIPDYLTQRVEFKNLFPEKYGKWALAGVYVFIAVTILITVLFSGYSSETVRSDAKSFDEPEFMVQDGADLDKAINLLNEVYDDTGKQEIKDILDGLYEGESLSALFYTEDYTMKTNYEEMSFYYKYMDEYTTDRYDNVLRSDVKQEDGIYNAAGFEYYKIENKELARYNIFILYGGAIANAEGEMDGFYPLINVHCWRSTANLSYAPLDFWGSRFEHEFVYEFLKK